MKASKRDPEMLKSDHLGVLCTALPLITVNQLKSLLKLWLCIEIKLKRHSFCVSQKESSITNSLPAVLPNN